MIVIETLARSRATGEFHAAVQEFLREGRPSARLSFDAYAPPVKVERTLIRVLEAYPELPIESVSIRASSGCEFFRGEALVRTAVEERRVAFWWDCKWKAVQAGWTDYFGFPDQARAAREFGHDCFRHWSEDEVRALSAQAAS